ncbi:MAG TPA: HEPN domain-containing protein [Mucilaginibacter sp.]|jgi:HEPN domain-containing protein
MNTELNQWANCPINLSTEEIENPFIVIDDFFSADDLDGHIKYLPKWRDRVINPGYYVDLKGSPSGLVWRHELNIKLVESVALILESSNFDLLTDVPAIDTNENKQEVALIKTKLNESEISNPLLVVNAFFHQHSVSWYREQLQEWLRYGLSMNAAKEFVNSPELITVYENFQKLYAAVWVLQTAYEANLNEGEQDKEAPPSNIRLYNLERETLPLHQQMLPNLVSIIINKLPSTYAIYYLGCKPGTHNTAFLLVLTADYEEREALSLGTMLEESCRPIDAFILVHYASAVVNAIMKGDHFFNRALSCPPLYISGNMLLPNSDVVKPSTVVELGEANWERWRKQAKEFLLGAEYYLSVKAYSAALFSLHQCAEDILIAIVRSVLGYKINSHNLLRLLRVTQFFTNDLAAVFQIDTEPGKTKFNILKDAYINVRYRDSYSPDRSSLDILYPMVTDLLSTAEQVHYQFLLRNSI